MAKVCRELRGGATQSTYSIESRPGAERRKCAGTPQRMSPLPDFHALRNCPSWKEA